MRTSFELKLVASNFEEAKLSATKEVAKFLGIEDSEVHDKVSLELKISYPKAETISEIEQSVLAGVFLVTVYGALKQSSAKPFGM